MLPLEDAVLLSFVNMKLRDFYSSLEELFEDLEEDPAGIEARLAAFGYRYSAERNQFVAQN